jgi:hypothetical protein
VARKSQAAAPQGHECYHCKQWIPKGAEHDCWTTTETALTKDLPEDLRDAWERIRETAVEFGDQRIYASLNSIMFARKVCYFFVRPGQKRLEVVFFLGRRVRSPLVRRSDKSSRVKHWHMVHVTHRDEVEEPLTGWLREAYDVSERLSARPARKPPKKKAGTKRAATKRAGTKKR